MNLTLMHWIDYWVGIPLCAACSFLNLLFVRPFRVKISNKVKKILFIELSEMGSTVLAYPSMKLAKEYYPEAELHFLIFKRNAESVQIFDIIKDENIHTIADNNLFSFSFSALRTILELRKAKFEIIIDLELFSRCTAFISFLIHSPINVGFYKYTEEGLYRGNLLTHNVHYNPHYHISQNFISLVESLRTDHAELPHTKIQVRSVMNQLPTLSFPKEKELALSLMKQINPGLSEKNKFVIINPDPGILALRAWPIENYRELVSRLLAFNSDVVIVTIGLFKSSKYHEQICEQNDRTINLCGKTDTLRDLLGLFEISTLLITNDSGPAHFAPLVGLKSIVFFGPESPYRYAPLSSLAAPLYSNYACSPCFSAQNHRNSICKNNLCLKEISVAEAQNVSLNILGLHKSPKNE